MHGLYVIIFTLTLYLVAANPVPPYDLELLRRDDTGNQFISPKAWVPIVVVVLVLCIIALMTWWRDSFRGAVGFFGGVHGATHAVGVPSSSNLTTARRELTAEQLVNDFPNSPTSGAARPNHRTRRQRRTPSQISITSLPAYKKEPGEEELVIFRSRDMEDATMPVATVVTHVDEDDDSLNSQEHSQVARYLPLPTTFNDMPLMHNDDPSGDLSLQSLPSPDADYRPSLDSGSQETSSLMRVDSNLPQRNSIPRDEAPPYFEVVDHIPESNSGEDPTSMPSSISPEPQPRRSGFRSFLNRMSMVSHPQQHRRTDSSQSVSTSNSHRRDRSTLSRTSTHIAPRSPSVFRTISRQRSNQTLNSSIRLNSPSLISLNSISSPLSHTLIRSEFTYPKSGLTPEQLKVISSRENFSRFGVPYGPDAIAFAASSSRQDLEPPPPDFEASSSQLSLVRHNPSSSLDNAQGRPSISEPILEHTTQSDSVTNTSTPITHPESFASSKVPNPIPPTDASSSSTSTHTVPPPLPAMSVLSEFGKLYASPNSLTPQDATGFSTRSGSRASNYSFQSYATAAESLGRERVGYNGVDSEPSTPRLGDRHMSNM